MNSSLKASQNGGSDNRSKWRQTFRIVPFDLGDTFFTNIQAGMVRQKNSEVASTWILQLFIEGFEDAGCNSRRILFSISNERSKEVTLTTYRELVKYLLKCGVTDYVLAKLHVEILHFTHLSKYDSKNVCQRSPEYVLLLQSRK